jgi:hypothetical protein
LTSPSAANILSSEYRVIVRSRDSVFALQFDLSGMEIGRPMESVQVQFVAVERSFVVGSTLLCAAKRNADGFGFQNFLL